MTPRARSRTRCPPENLHVFPSDQPASFHIEEHGVALHGQSFATREITEDLSLGYPDPRAGWFNIGVLHTSCDGRPGHDSYAPCNPERLRAAGYDCWALGHVHGREILCEDPPIVFPGCPQGRHPRGRAVPNPDRRGVRRPRHRARG